MKKKKKGKKKRKKEKRGLYSYLYTTYSDSDEFCIVEANVKHAMRHPEKTLAFCLSRSYIGKNVGFLNDEFD